MAGPRAPLCSNSTSLCSVFKSITSTSGSSTKTFVSKIQIASSPKVARTKPCSRLNKKVKFATGFTGHKDPSVHLRMIQLAEKNNFKFDTVQMPVNVLDAGFRSFSREGIPVALQKNIAVLAMKSIGDKHILESKTVTPIECLHYSLSTPASVVITGIDSMPILDQAFEAAKTSKDVSKSDIAAILQKTATVAADGKFEPFKTSQVFDSTAAHPEWLGYNPQAG